MQWLMRYEKGVELMVAGPLKDTLTYLFKGVGLIIIYSFFIYKGKIVISQTLLFKIIYNILTSITSLTIFNKLSSHIHSNIPQSKQPQLSSHFHSHSPLTFHSPTLSNPNTPLRCDIEKKVPFQIKELHQIMYNLYES